MAFVTAAVCGRELEVASSFSALSVKMAPLKGFLFNLLLRSFR